jgi:hypothetical protein
MRRGIRLSRVDGWLNDRRRLAEPEDVLEAFRAGCAVSHTTRSRFIDDSRTGTTCAIGSRSSELYLRVYDKDRQAGTSGAGVRWELEAKAARAQQLAERWTACSDPAATLLGILRGFVDFRDRSAGDHGDRAPLLPWWAELIDGAPRAVLATPRRRDSLAKRAAWLEAQAAKSLAMVHVAYGPDFIRDLLEIGERRLTAAEWRLVGVVVDEAEP